MEIRPIKEEDLDAFMNLMEVAFLSEFGEEGRANLRSVIELDRSFGAFDGDQLVGTISAYSFDLTVPGRRILPMAGTTIATVRPTHRRRGILRRLIEVHLEDVRQRAEPLAGLWASEATIYGRFGYGCAIDFVSLRLSSDKAIIDGPIDDRLQVRMVDRDHFEDAAMSLYEAARLLQPGLLSRTASWWQARRFADLADGRRGASAFRYILVTREGQPLGYAQYRTKDINRDGVAAGEVAVAELLALDVDAELALWRFLFSIDLTVTVRAPLRSAEDPILQRLTDRRAAQVTTSDGVYLRLMDVAKALTGRCYAMPGVLTLEVAGPPDIAGTYRLTVDASGEASCIVADGSADVQLDARTLASVYLGGHRIRAFARAGRILGSAEAICCADAIFSAENAPIAPEIF